MDWPDVVPEPVREAFAAQGVHQPFAHQAHALTQIAAGTHTVLATGTASGKSLAYQAAVASGVLGDTPRATALYLSPTKALGADQLTSWERLNGTLKSLTGSSVLQVGTYDGDTGQDERFWVRDYANVVITNPDMLHVGILPSHARWARFFRHLRWIIIDEAHSYRGVFGSHMATVLRRLSRIIRHYAPSTDQHPHAVFIGASATSANPAASFTRLTGVSPEAQAITEDTSGHGAVHVGLWEPEFTDAAGSSEGASPTEAKAPVRRSLIATGADLMTDLSVNSVRSLAFIRSRRGAEAMAQSAKRQLAEVDPALPGRVAVYRAGLLPEERREVETRLSDGRLLGVATTPALELGIDISGVDAVIISGWPGTRASFFQQLGRAGRAGQDAYAFFVAGSDPMDTYLVHHPEAIFDQPVEDAVTDPSNPHILGPHLCAAAEELHLTPQDFELFGDPAQVRALVDQLVAAGYLRRRPAGWFWTHPESAAQMISLRDSAGAGPLAIVDAETGTLLGDISSSQAHAQVHPGAVYVHQGRTWLVEDLDEDNSTVLVVRHEPTYYTQARDITEIEILDEGTGEAIEELTHPEEGFTWATGPVKVTTQVVSYQRRELITSRLLGEEPLDLPATELFTEAVWFTAPTDRFITQAGLTTDRMPGALHAAEHAMIGMLPLVASNDRWDIGGVSLLMHPDTGGQPTVFVYDGHPGGAGFASRGYDHALRWVTATRDAILACECPEGCPSCVQSPKCGNRNEPLDKRGAVQVLSYVADVLSAT